MYSTTVDAVRVAEIAKALAHPARVQIVELLARQAECRGADVFAELPLAQSTVSEHLRVLRDAGVVSSSPVGTSTVYCLRYSALEELCSGLGVLVKERGTCGDSACRREGIR